MDSRYQRGLYWRGPLHFQVEDSAPDGGTAALYTCIVYRSGFFHFCFIFCFVLSPKSNHATTTTTAITTTTWHQGIIWSQTHYSLCKAAGYVYQQFHSCFGTVHRWLYKIGFKGRLPCAADSFGPCCILGMHPTSTAVLLSQEDPFRDLSWPCLETKVWKIVLCLGLRWLAHKTTNIMLPILFWLFSSKPKKIMPCDSTNFISCDTGTCCTYTLPHQYQSWWRGPETHYNLSSAVIITQDTQKRHYKCQWPHLLHTLHTKKPHTRHARNPYHLSFWFHAHTPHTSHWWESNNSKHTTVAQ